MIGRLPWPVHPRACGEQQVHPRACGEQENDPTVVRVIGSSPRLRGTASRALAVHPRACGEQIPNTTVNSCSSGSSPRLRGTGLSDWSAPLALGSSPRLRGTEASHGSSPRRFIPATEALRFIPAPAGNSLECFRNQALMAVHPRACGEQSFWWWFSLMSTGSSPRLRGTEPDVRPAVAPVRFIPAPAGNSSKQHL